MIKLVNVIGYLKNCSRRRLISLKKIMMIVARNQRKSAPKTVTRKGVIARLQECGPRFTLKLQSLQAGTFDSKYGEYEWVHKLDMDMS